MTLLDLELRGRPIDEAARNFRAWRRTNKVTITIVAGILGVHPSSVNHFELGRRPTSKTLRARLLELSLTWNESMRPPRKPETRGGWRGGLKRLRSGTAARPAADSLESSAIAPAICASAVTR